MLYILDYFLSVPEAPSRLPKHVLLCNAVLLSGLVGVVVVQVAVGAMLGMVVGYIVGITFL